MLVARLLSDTCLQYRGWPPPFARPSADRISVSTTSFSPAYGDVIPQCVRALLAQKAHAYRRTCQPARLFRSAPFQLAFVPGASDLDSRGAILFRCMQSPIAQCGAGWWWRYLSPSVRRGGNKFTIYAERSISICISSKYAGIELRNE